MKYLSVSGASKIGGKPTAHASQGGHGIALHGMLELFSLSECANAPSSGKGIVGRVQKYTAGYWKPSPGSIYPVLARLEESGSIRPHLEKRANGGKREIVYRITPQGRARLETQKKCLSEKFEAMLNAVNPLLFRIMYGLKDDEIEELREFMGSLTEFKKHLALIPYKARAPQRTAFFEALKKEFGRIKSMKVATA